MSEFGMFGSVIIAIFLVVLVVPLFARLVFACWGLIDDVLDHLFGRF